MTKIGVNVGGETIEIEPNTVQFEEGKPERRFTPGFDLWIPRSVVNQKMVERWVEEGVDSAELTTHSGKVYTLTGPGTATADFYTYGNRGEIHVKINGGRK